MDFVWNDWMSWTALAACLLVLELLTGTFYLLMLAVGMLGGIALALMGASGSTQTIGAALLASVGVLWLHASRFGWRQRRRVQQDADVLLDIGQTVHVSAWHSDGRHYLARVAYRGAQWDCELAEGQAAQAGPHRICEVRGSCLLLTPQTN